MLMSKRSVFADGTVIAANPILKPLMEKQNTFHLNTVCKVLENLSWKLIFT